MSWELRHGIFTPEGRWEQIGLRLRAIRYSKIPREKWWPMLALIALAFALMVAFVLVGLLTDLVF